MSYAPPSYNAVNFQGFGESYTPPDADAVNFTLDDPVTKGPSSDVSAGDWQATGGGALYAALDEDPIPDDADYIYASDITTCIVAFPTVSDPAVSTGHTARYRLLAGSGSVSVTLKQGSTTIASWGPHDLGANPQNFAQTLTETQADSITDYTALRVDLTTS
jgi:hypothetical protein